MKNKIYFLITIICIYTTNAIALNLLPEFLFAKYHAHKAFQNKDYQKTKSILEKEQVQNPNNPYVNYNLGTVFYKLKEYNNAKENFQRATQNFSINNKQFLEQTNFNLGNCFYKNTLVTLGENWEKEEIKEEVLVHAINEIKSSIEKYKNSLNFNDKNNKTKTNLKTAEELLKKLEQKQQNQQNQNKKENPDKENKQDQQNQKQDSQKQDQKQNNQEQDKQENQDKEHKQNQQNQKQDPQKQDQKQNNQEQDKQENQDKENKQDQQKTKQQQIQKQEKLNQESMQEKRMQVLLDKLQTDEKNIQKAIIKQKIKTTNKSHANQKPW